MRTGLGEWVASCWSITVVVPCIWDQSHDGKRWDDVFAGWTSGLDDQENKLSVGWGIISLHSHVMHLMDCMMHYQGVWIRVVRGERRKFCDPKVLSILCCTKWYLMIFCILRPMNLWDRSHGGKRWERTGWGGGCTRVEWRTTVPGWRTTAGLHLRDRALIKPGPNSLLPGGLPEDVATQWIGALFQWSTMAPFCSR